MRSLVLGGTVFVGRHLVMELQQRGHDVSVLNRGRTPGELPPGVERLVADRTDVAQMRSALAQREWDAVFDVSGFVMAAGGGDIDRLLDLFEGRVARYLYVSSVMAYDQGQLGIMPWTEDLPVNPDGPATYGGFKAAVEEALLSRWRDRRFPALVIRPAAIYGPHNNIFDMETPMWLRLREHRPILLPHEGLVTGSYGHVDDLCRAMVDAVGVDAALGEVFNLSGGAITTQRYVDELAEIVGAEPHVVPLPESTLRSLDRPPFGHLFGRAHHAVVDISKARGVLGFTPVYDFKDGHRHTYEWFLSDGPHIDGPLRDPLWKSTWDFEYEASVAAQLGA